MEYINKIKKMLCKELEEYSTKHKLTVADLEMVHKLTDTVKNLDKITMLEEEGGYSEARHPMGIYRDEYSRDGGEWRAMGSYDDGVSYRRGRGRNAKRDSWEDTAAMVDTPRKDIRKNAEAVCPITADILAMMPRTIW